MKLNHIDVGMGRQLVDPSGSITITLNEFLEESVFTTVREAVEAEGEYIEHWATDDQMIRAVNANTMWTLRIRPGVGHPERVLRFSAIKTLIWVIVHGSLYQPPAKGDVE